MKAIVFPVKNEGSKDDTDFTQCSIEEAEYFGLYIEHEPGYQLHVKDYKRKKKADEMAASLNLALQP